MQESGFFFGGARGFLGFKGASFFALFFGVSAKELSSALVTLFSSSSLRTSMSAIPVKKCSIEKKSEVQYMKACTKDPVNSRYDRFQRKIDARRMGKFGVSLRALYR